MKVTIKHDDGTNVIKLGNPSRVVTAEVILQPAAQFPWHFHSGPVFVTVAEGELVYVQANDCVPHSYPAGTVLVDPGNMVHTAFNPTDGVTRLVATYFDTPATGPLTITEGVVPPADCTVGPGTHAAH